MHNILVTGNAGFIGMHTALKLASHGYKVVGLDNINEYYDINLKYARLKEQGISKEEVSYGKLVHGNTLDFIQLDLTDQEGVEQVFKKYKFDAVIHLAAQAGVTYSLEVPHFYLKSNVTGFLNILEACRHFSIEHMIFASSSSVYGLNQAIPFHESHSTEHPMSVYGATKKADEMLAHSYAHLFNIPVTGLRFFTVYGPWGRPDMAIFKFVHNIIEEKPINVYNYGDMYRDFTYIHDITEAIFKIIDKNPVPKDRASLPEGTLTPDISTAPYSIFNIGNNKPVNLMEFISTIENALNKKAQINYEPLQAGDVPSTHASCDKLFKFIQYKPGTSLQEGVTEFVKWFKDYYKI